jgi:hypothetical protein
MNQFIAKAIESQTRISLRGYQIIFLLKVC